MHLCLAFLDSLQAADTHSPSDADYRSVGVLTTLQGHISSVKALSSSPSHLGSSCKLLFSGGARASLKVWLITSKYIASEICFMAILQTWLSGLYLSAKSFTVTDRFDSWFSRGT